MIRLCCDGRKFGHDINCMRTKINQVKFVATKISMSQQIAQQATRTREEKSNAIKENFVVTEIVQESKKSCRDRIDKLKRKFLS